MLSEGLNIYIHILNIMKLLIFYLTSESRHYTFPHFINLLNQSKRKDQWTLCILTHSNDSFFYQQIIETLNMSSVIVTVPTENNYMTKVKFACQYAEDKGFPYVMKCDNDIFFTSNTLDYMIDNLSILDNDKHLTLGPVLSSGIPTVEYFSKQFLNKEESNILENLYLQTNMYNPCPGDNEKYSYDSLNKHTIQATEWNSSEFFKSVWNLNHLYKGIHPIRLNHNAIDYVNQYILNNKSKFFNSTPTKLITDDTSPYLCDTIFCIRTEKYKKIIYSDELFIDGYDEIPLNRYAVANGMNHVFTENGFGIHILYNWFSNIYQYEHQFCNIMFS